MQDDISTGEVQVMGGDSLASLKDKVFIVDINFNSCVVIHSKLKVGEVHLRTVVGLITLD